MNICIHIHIWACIRKNVTNTLTYEYIYLQNIYIHIHTHTHKVIHTHVLILASSTHCVVNQCGLLLPVCVSVQ